MALLFFRALKYFFRNNITKAVMCVLFEDSNADYPNLVKLKLFFNFLNLPNINNK